MENKLISFGDKAIDFTYQTPYGKTSTLEEKVQKADKTFLIFLRYHGCTICQLDIRAYRENYQKFLDKDAQILLVLQSAPATIAESITEEELRFEVACDPEGKLYNLYQVGQPGASWVWLPSRPSARSRQPRSWVWSTVPMKAMSSSCRQCSCWTAV